MKTKFALVDHKLRESGGHQIRMAEIFLGASDEFVAFGCDECALQHKRLVNHFSTDHRVAHRFPEMPGAGSGLLRSVLHYLRCILVVLKSNVKYFHDLRRIETARDVVWFTPNTQQFTFPALILFAFLHPSRRIAAYFQNAPGKYLKICGALMKILRLRNLVCIAEEELMGERMTTLMGLPVRAILYPLLPRAFTEQAITREANPERPIAIAVLGLPRREKGFHLIPPVIRALEDKIAAEEIRFVIQTGDQSQDCEGLDSSIASLRSHPGVELIERTLEPQDYLSELLRCGVVLTPYLKESYAQRLSWISIEGAALAKPVIVTEGTLAAGFIKSFGAGVEFPDQDVEAMVAAISRVSEDYEAYRDGAWEAGASLRAANSTERFFSAVAAVFN